MSHYYNEHDPKAAAWLRQLIAAGLIPAGMVDERDIREVTDDDVKGYTQAHFFAGIGGWPLALRLAGWPEDRTIWTGSCPCQPFSSAGKGKGTSDERHLWPAFSGLIAERRPATVIGEQVESAVRHGWLDGVFADLEAAGYACGAVVLGAHSVGSPHIRQRLFWVADAGTQRWEWRPDSIGPARQGAAERSEGLSDAERDGNARGMAVAEHGTRGIRSVVPGETSADEDSAPGQGDGYAVEHRGVAGRLGDTIGARSQRLAGHGDGRRESGRLAAESDGPAPAASGDGFWSDYEIIPFRDGKVRRIESGTFPLAHGVPARVGRLRGYGNAIVPQVAAEFITAYLEAEIAVTGMNTPTQIPARPAETPDKSAQNGYFQVLHGAYPALTTETASGGTESGKSPAPAVLRSPSDPTDGDGGRRMATDESGAESHPNPRADGTGSAVPA